MMMISRVGLSLSAGCGLLLALSLAAGPTDAAPPQVLDPLIDHFQNDGTLYAVLDVARARPDSPPTVPSMSHDPPYDGTHVLEMDLVSGFVALTRANARHKVVVGPQVSVGVQSSGAAPLPQFLSGVFSDIRAEALSGFATTTFALANPPWLPAGETQAGTAWFSVEFAAGWDDELDIFVAVSLPDRSLRGIEIYPAGGAERVLVAPGWEGRVRVQLADWDVVLDPGFSQPVLPTEVPLPEEIQRWSRPGLTRGVPYHQDIRRAPLENGEIYAIPYGQYPAFGLPNSGAGSPVVGPAVDRYRSHPCETDPSATVEHATRMRWRAPSGVTGTADTELRLIVDTAIPTSPVDGCVQLRARVGSDAGGPPVILDQQVWEVCHGEDLADVRFPIDPAVPLHSVSVELDAWFQGACTQLSPRSFGYVVASYEPYQPIFCLDGCPVRW